MTEWLKEHVWKACVLFSTEGSNPSLSEKKMKKLISSILFISCTSIGAGILALPCLTAYNGFLYSFIAFTICCFFMTIGSLSILEATLWFKKNTNIISIVNQILGYKWKILISIIYISLLYSLISAYILAYMQWITSEKLSQLTNTIIGMSIYIIIISLITFYKNKMIDSINNLLSILLFITYIIIIIKCFNYINTDNIKITKINNLSNILTLAITSFGFGVIIPTLTNFLKKDYKKLYKSILIGSMIPLTIYTIWILVMIGIFPLHGEYSLKNISEQKISADIIFANFIQKVINYQSITIFIKIFSLSAILTSLIGVSTSLKDFLSDERILKKNNKMILLLIAIPPIITLNYLNLGFISILKISGILVALLLGIIPITIIWYGRYRLCIPSKIMIPGGKPLLIVSYIFFFYSIINDVIMLI